MIAPATTSRNEDRQAHCLIHVLIKGQRGKGVGVQEVAQKQHHVRGEIMAAAATTSRRESAKSSLKHAIPHRRSVSRKQGRFIGSCSTPSSKARKKVRAER